MRITQIALLTGAAAIVTAGFAGMAQARTSDTHVLALQLPNGQIEQVRYTGDVPPTVILAPEAMPAALGSASPFAMLDQISAAMDRQAQILFQDINALTGPNVGAFGMIPAASEPGVCTRSVQITFNGNGERPHVVSRTSGDCGPVRGSAAPVALPDAPVQRHAPDVVQAKAANPYQGLVHPVSDWQR